MTTTTANDGSYHFTGLLPGTYTITETRPGGFVDEDPNIGTGASNDGALVPPTGSSVTSNAIGGIVLAAGQDGVNFNFGEQNIPNG
jgi:hypothetical protein